MVATTCQAVVVPVKLQTAAHRDRPVLQVTRDQQVTVAERQKQNVASTKSPGVTCGRAFRGVPVRHLKEPSRTGTAQP